ncbi:hypothetical protein Tco_0539311 [Tanacetum coccineum]
MANLSEDIQCAGSDTRPPMLDRTDFASWQQRIRLYCRGKENGPETTKSLFNLSPKDRKGHMGQCEDAPEGSELTKEDRESQLRVVVQNVQGQQNRGQGNNAWGGGAADIGHITRNCTQPKRPQNSEYFKDKMLLMQAQENRVALDEEQLLFIVGRQDNAIDEYADEQPVQDLALNVDNVFQADDCDAFDSDVDEAPTAQTMFMANLSSVDPVYDEAGPSYDSDILSEVHDHDHYQDAFCEHHEEYEMHDDYVKDNAVSVVQSNVSSVTNDAYMMIFNDMHETHAQPVLVTTQNAVVDNSLTAELATYKEQVELYERRAMFELTEREQKIDEQLRIVITDRNIKEETLKKELHSVKIQLAFTINLNKSMVEEVTFLKKDFKQEENKYLEEFLNIKALKEKAEVDQNVVDRKHDEIERKNLLIAHDNLITDCLSKEVFYVATNSELNVSRFTEMHDAHTIVEARCLELEDLAFLIYITQLTEKVIVLQEQNELFKAKNAKIKQHYKELYDSIKITHAKHLRIRTKMLDTTKNENLKAQMQTKMKSVTKDHVKPTVLAPGKYAIDVEPIPPRNRNNREVYLDYLRHLKESVETLSEIVEEAKVERPLDRTTMNALQTYIPLPSSTSRKIVGGHIMTSSHIFKGLVLPCTLVVSFPAGYMVFLLVAHCYYWSLVVTAGSSRFVLALQTVSIGCVTFLLVVCAG